jgi:hypothetical protein
MPANQPDDWQQAAALHRQQQFDANVKRVGKQARRGNRITGGCLMFMGAFAMLLGAAWIFAVQDSRVEFVTEHARGLLWLFVGGFFTCAAGWAIWRGQWRDPR